MEKEMNVYQINIFYSEEDGCYVADTPDLVSCFAFGKTPEQALAEVEKAKKVWLEAARKTGRQIPPPRYRPVIYQTAGATDDDLAASVARDKPKQDGRGDVLNRP